MFLLRWSSGEGGPEWERGEWRDPAGFAPRRMRPVARCRRVQEGRREAARTRIAGALQQLVHAPDSERRRRSGQQQDGCSRTGGCDRTGRSRGALRPPRDGRSVADPFSLPGSLSWCFAGHLLLECWPDRCTVDAPLQRDCCTSGRLDCFGYSAAGASPVTIKS